MDLVMLEVVIQKLDTDDDGDITTSDDSTYERGSVATAIRATAPLI